jgi:tRNA (adenine37-N6)-methyltransferase
MMNITFKPIGTAHTDIEKVPRHWTVSEVKGRLVIDRQYLKGLKDIEPGQQIIVLFHFDRSQPFSEAFLVQNPPHRRKDIGVFSICSPIRPNPIGLSVLEVLSVEDNVLHVNRVDMLDGTPILDIKPLVRDEASCPSHEGHADDTGRK